VPVSKKRKKKGQKSYGPPPPKSVINKKKGLTRQQILIYIISGVMILSLAAGFIVRSSGRTAPQNNTSVPQSVEENSPLIETVTPEESQTQDSGENIATPEQDSTTPTEGEDSAAPTAEESDTPDAEK
jgi:cytoskeletal protein RodZ